LLNEEDFWFLFSTTVSFLQALTVRYPNLKYSLRNLSSAISDSNVTRQAPLLRCGPARALVSPCSLARATPRLTECGVRHGARQTSPIEATRATGPRVCSETKQSSHPPPQCRADRPPGIANQLPILVLSAISEYITGQSHPRRKKTIEMGTTSM
jgi:hypothetical protein